MNKVSGYCEVNLGGKVRPIKFGMGAWSIIADERNLPLADITKGLNELSFVAWITYAGCKYACLAGYSDLPAPKSIYEVQDWFDDAEPEVMKIIGQTFAKSRTNGKTISDIIAKVSDNEPEPDPQKKKKPSRK